MCLGFGPHFLIEIVKSCVKTRDLNLILRENKRFEFKRRSHGLRRELDYY